MGYKPKGEELKFGAMAAYLVGEGENGILMLPDIFPWSTMKGRLMGIADSFADEGYKVLLIDPFRGESAEGLEGNDMYGWIGKYKWEGSVAKDINNAVELLVGKGCTAIGCIGFCWGAWAMCKAMSEGVDFVCGVGPHPSTMIEKALMGGDEDAMMMKVTKPVLLLPSKAEDAKLKEGGAIAEHLVKQGGKSITFEDMEHGFFCRGDLAEPGVMRDVQASMKHTIEFFKANLKECPKEKRRTAPVQGVSKRGSIKAAAEEKS